jgi:tetratricopeptide (TPR) repeat protein/predicted Ser/Thr protein kinase
VCSPAVSRDEPSLAGSETDELGRMFAEEHEADVARSEQRAAARVRAALLGDAAQVPGLARYRLRRVLGEGAMGQVWLADDPELARPVAIKLLSTRSGPRDAVHAQRLAREARAMAKVSHPNVLPVFDVGTGRDDAEVFIVMEYVDGETLAAWMTGRHTPREIVAMFVQAATGLDAAHRAGLVHRDFKPANVMIGRDGRARVADFGLARTDHEAKEHSGGALHHDELSITQGASLTKTGLVVGTPLYMSPEQHRGGAVDVRSDQYAFCVALYEALAGARPFAGGIHELARAKLDERLAPIAASRGVPERIVAVVRRGLAADPAARWPSMAVLAARLGRATAPRRRALAGAAACACGLAALVLVAAPNVSGECVVAEHTWTAAERAAVSRGLDERVGVQQRELVVSRLDDLERAWSQASDGACAASPAVQLCLRDAAKQLERTATLLASGDTDRDAMLLVDALPRPSDCTQEHPGSGSPVGGRELALRDALADARSDGLAGHVDEATAALHRIREEALGWGDAGRSIAMRAALEIAYAYLHADLPAEAAPWLRLGFFEASAQGDDEAALLCAAPLVMVAIGARDDLAIDEWLRHAETLAARSPPGDAGYQVLHLARGAVATMRDDFAAAEREFSAVMTWADASERPTAWLPSARNLVLALDRRGAHDEAAALAQRVLERTSAVFGDDSRETAARRAEVGAHLVRSDRDAGIAQLRRAIDVLDRPGTPPTRALSTALRALGLALADAGDHAAAIDACSRAIEVTLATDPDNHVQRAIVLASLGSVRIDAGDLEAARRDLDAALALLDDWTGTERGVVLGLLADVEAKQGDIDGALASYRAAIAVWLDLGGHDTTNILLTYTNAAVTLHHHGRCADSLQMFGEARGFAIGKAVGADALAQIDAASAVAQSRCGQSTEARVVLEGLRGRVEAGSEAAGYVALAEAEIAEAGSDARARALAEATAIADATGAPNLLRAVTTATKRSAGG